MGNEGKVAFITGGAKRVGRAITIALHENGYRVFIHCNSALSVGEQLKEELNKKRQDSAEVIARDLSVNIPKNTQEIIDTAASKWGRLDLLVNNASSFIPGTLLEMTEQDFDHSINVNVKAPVFLMQAAAKYLKKQKGCIINMTDVMGAHPSKTHFAHPISKSALLFVTKCAALQLGPEIRVNDIAPGVVEWPDVDQHIFDVEKKKNIMHKTPLQRFGTPEDVANLVLFLSSSESAFITGVSTNLDGGFSLGTY